MAYVTQDCYFLGLNTQSFHKVYYKQWGSSKHKDIVICVHGLTRNHHDFDYLAQTLCKDFCVICPDIVGRGKSDYLPHAYDYHYPQYLSDLNILMNMFSSHNIHWVGTSMGGLLGMILASLPGSPIQSLILNDIGYTIPLSGLQRLSQYLAKEHFFSSFEDGVEYFKKNFKGYGALPPTIWQDIAKNSMHLAKDMWKLSYDYSIAKTAIQATEDVNFSQYWHAITKPVLVLRGEYSDLFPKDIAQNMANLPHVTYQEIAGTGHAPSLMVPEQTDLIRQWLLKRSTP